MNEQEVRVIVAWGSKESPRPTWRGGMTYVFALPAGTWTLEYLDGRLVAREAMTGEMIPVWPGKQPEHVPVMTRCEHPQNSS